MKKRLFTILTIVIMLISIMVVFSACSKKTEFGENVLINSNFEEISSSGKISNWTISNTSTVSFKKNIRDDSDSYDASLENYYVKFDLSSSSYDYITQNVTLDKNAIYKITAYVKVDSIVETSGVGVRFGFDTGVDFKGLNIVDSTEEKWINVEYYFTSGTKKEVKFTVGIGSPKTNTSGVAYVDNIKLVKVKTIPTTYLDNREIEVLKTDSEDSLSTSSSIIFVVLMSIATLALLIVIYFGIKKAQCHVSDAVKEEEKVEEKNQNNQEKAITLGKIKDILTSKFAMFVYIMLGTLIIRFIITICSYGMASSIDDLQHIASLSLKNFISFYSANEKVTNPSGVTLVYGILARIADSLAIKSSSLGYAILMRMPMLVADVITVYVIYNFVAKYKNEFAGFIYSSIYAFVPLFFMIGSFMGMTEVIAITFLLCMSLAILDKNYISSGILYTIGLMFSHYMLVVLPIIFIFQVYGIVKDKENRMTIILTMVLSFVLFYMLSAVFTWSDFIKGNLFVYFERILKFFNDSKFLSTDTFNIYGMFGVANNKERNSFVLVLNWLFVGGLSLWPAYLYIKNKNRSDLLLNAATLLIAYSVVGAQSTIVILPMGLVLLLIYLAIVPDNRLYLCFTLFTTLCFINITQLASQSGYISNISGATYTAFAPHSPIMIIFSIITVLTFCYFAFVNVDIAYYNKALEIKPLEGNLKDNFISMFKQLTLKFNKKGKNSK